MALNPFQTIIRKAPLGKRERIGDVERFLDLGFSGVDGRVVLWNEMEVWVCLQAFRGPRPDSMTRQNDVSEYN